jgi:hypothetical protein
MRTRNRSLFWGSLLVALGVVWLLRSAEVIDPDVSIWPFLLLGLGAWLLAEALVQRSWRDGGSVLPLVLIAIGGVYLLRDLDVIDRDVSVWPLVLIAIGVGIVVSAVPGRPRGAVATETVPIDGAASARIEVGHGAGRLAVRPTLDPETLLSGRFAGGADLRVDRDGDHAKVRLRQDGDRAMAYLFPWSWSRGQTLDWEIELSRRVRLELAFKTGANQANLDLRDLMVSDLSIETGASQTDVTLPASGVVRASVKGGAAGIKLTVPERTAAQIVARGGLASIKVDERRFPSFVGGHRSPDYDSAENRIDLTIEVGAADVEVR